ncbi:hypothetical protein [Variovorax sp. UMC13]|uniref:hypothetical protein n=1 Tax=Variovorax sp. UMC13 TaxID=1862326 RepID=UPI0016014B46|nr:hypothetical protein [Variovorax sp. UMC13]
MKKRRIAEGDIYSVPLGDGLAAVCRVPFCSTYFKDLVQLSVFGKAVPDKSPLEQCAGVPILQIFTGQDCAPSMGWTLLASTPTTLEDERTSKRIVAGEVWIGDTPLGPVGSPDETLPKMLVYGCALLRKTLIRTVA